MDSTNNHHSNKNISDGFSTFNSATLKWNESSVLCPLMTESGSDRTHSIGNDQGVRTLWVFLMLLEGRLDDFTQERRRSLPLLHAPQPPPPPPPPLNPLQHILIPDVQGEPKDDGDFGVRHTVAIVQSMFHSMRTRYWQEFGDRFSYSKSKRKYAENDSQKKLAINNKKSRDTPTN
ncbi:hypothetical protein Sjap_011991 [Stephania japonica]|uniref:Uncharacterized protein n=1 Tax=Stephania japonica TaxID=461633 RepID=A0AAP0JCF5_9MAGN